MFAQTHMSEDNEKNVRKHVFLFFMIPVNNFGGILHYSMSVSVNMKL